MPVFPSANRKKQGRAIAWSTVTVASLGEDIETTLGFIRSGLADTSLRPLTIEDFKTDNKVSGKIDKLSLCDVGIVIVDGKQLKSTLAKGDGWKSLREKYSKFKFIVNLSKVTLGDKHDQALVYMSIVKGIKSAYGTYYFLEKDKDGWKVKATLNAWES